MRSERLDLVVLAHTAAHAGATRDVDALARALQRFAPASFSVASWRDAIESARARVARLDARHEVASRLRLKRPVRWTQLADRLLPAHALGIAPTDSATLGRLADRDGWTAAIAARMLGMWSTGAPPSLPAVCDAFVWRALGLRGRARRCPPEVRAVFLQRELDSAPGTPDRQLRLFVARGLETGTELRAMRDGLVRRWLAGCGLDETRDFGSDAKDAARRSTLGTFGDRKVFIASAWELMRRQPTWAAISLAEFKMRLLAAQRSGELELARADLVAAMDSQLVSASETLGDGATFHFIVRGESA